MTVDELSNRMTAAEEVHWIAFYQASPFPIERAEIGLAQIAQLIWNTNVKKDNTRKLVDFLPWYRKQKKPAEDVSTSILSAFGNIKKDK